MGDATRFPYRRAEVNSSNIISSLIYRGEIATNGDFPPVPITIGYYYRATANVTSALTGQSFVDGDEFYWNGKNWSFLGNIYYDSAGGGLTWIAKSANYDIQVNEGVLADTTGGTWTLTLPASPSVGDVVGVSDSKTGFVANNLIVARNGKLIHGIAEDLILDVDDASFTLIYTGTTTGWKIETYLSQGFDEVAYGPSGPTGPTGPMGAGETGPTGSQGITGITGMTGYGGLVWIEKTANYTAVAGEGILAGTTGAGWTLWLPSTPDVGDVVGVIDRDMCFEDFNLQIDGNGEFIIGQTGVLVCDVSDVSFNLVYTDGTGGWRLVTSGLH